MADPLSINWKDKTGIFSKSPKKEIASRLEELGGTWALERVKRILIAYMQSLADCITESPPTIDFKLVKVVHDARGDYPLEILHQRGHIVTMFCRPDPRKEIGILYKFCPKDLTCSEFELRRKTRQFNVDFEPTQPLSLNKKFHPLNQQLAAEATV